MKDARIHLPGSRMTGGMNRKGGAATLLALAACLWMGALSKPCDAATFVVDRTDDEPTATACTGHGEW